MRLNTPKTNPRIVATAISGKITELAVNLVQITVTISSRKNRLLANVLPVPMAERVPALVGVPNKS